MERWLKVGDFLKDFVKSFDELDFGERKLLIESLVQNVVIGKNKKVTVTLQPPLNSLGFNTPHISATGPTPRMTKQFLLITVLTNISVYLV